MSRYYETVGNKKHCLNFKKGKCVSVINPQPLDSFKIFSIRIGSHQRCNACLAFYVKKQVCLNFKHGTCFSKENPQSLENFTKHIKCLTKNKICKSCKDSDKKYCSNYKKGTCASPINPQLLDNFDLRSDKNHIRRPQCKSCNNKYYAVNKAQIRMRTRIWAKESGFNEHRRDKLHKLDPGQYDQMFAAQRGFCGICNRHQSEFDRPLAVDHNHVTDKIRGLLCDGCNQGIGMLKDISSIVRLAADYIDMDGSNHSNILGERQGHFHGK
jgi:hypothetical protein